MDQMEITLSPNFDFRKMRTLMSRDRHQSGYVSLHGKRVKKWYGFYHLYIVGKDGEGTAEENLGSSRGKVQAEEMGS